MAGKTQIVRTIFIGEDRLTAQIDALKSKMAPLENLLSRPFIKAKKAANLFWSVLKSMVVFRAVSATMSGIERGISEVTREYISFDSAITQAAAKFPGRIQQGTEAFRALGEAARHIGATTRYTATEAAEGLKYLAMAGFTAEGAIAALPVVTNLATASGEDFARVSDIATDALGAFNLASQDAAVQASNLTRISDVFTATVTGANVTLENMYNSMRDGGPIMTSAGQSVETFGALVAAMGNAGIKGSKAGTTLKNAFLRLQAPPKEAAKALQSLNIQVAKNGKMRDFLDILADMEKAFKNVSEVERNQKLSKIFGRYAVAGMSKIFSQGSTSVREFRNNLEKAGGTSEAVAKDIEKSLGNRLLALKSSLIEAGFKVLEAFHDRFPNALETAIEAVRNFNVQSIIDGLEAVIGFVKSAWEFWKKWRAEILAGIQVYIAFKAAFRVFKTIDTAVKGLEQFKVAMKAATTAQAMFNVVAALNPWVLLAVGILALVAIVIYLIKNWDKLQKVWIDGLESMSEYNNTYINELSGLNSGIMEELDQSWVDFKNTFIEIWNDIKRAFSETMQFIAEGMKNIPILGDLFGGVDTSKLGVGQTKYAKTNKFTGLAAALETKKQAKGMADYVLENYHGKGGVRSRALKFDRGVVPDAAARGWGAPRDEALNHSIFMEIAGLPEQGIVNKVRTEKRPGSHVGSLAVDVRKAGVN